MKKLMSAQDFIIAGIKKYGNRFDYSNFDYVNGTTKSLIICSKCYNKIYTTPYNHLNRNKNGCKICGFKAIGNSKRNSLQERLDRANQIHNFKYDYSLITNYLNGKVKVEIICKEHGSFFQNFTKHINCKQGCPKCSGRLKHTLQDTIRAASVIHNNYYDYSKITSYTSRNEKLEIICPEHGSFWQNMHHHINAKKGCWRCSNTSPSNTNDFIEKSIKIHGNKYCYELVEYKKSNINVKIKCILHDTIFNQKPSKHLSGQGCSLCSKERKSQKEGAWLTTLNIPDDKNHREVKITLNGKTFFVDGFDPLTNTVYEFNGDYWHGNRHFRQNGSYPFHPEKIHPVNKKSYGELYWKTLERQKIIEDAGYNLVVMWESDWDKLIKVEK